MHVSSQIADLTTCDCMLVYLNDLTWTSGKMSDAFGRDVERAMKAGVPIVPVYGFGHTQLVTLVTDPFGILESLSLKLDTSLAPYYGRWGIPFGPPRREPVLMALGDPVRLPKCEKPTPEQVDEGHKAMLAGFSKVFETHKVAYGWPDKELRFV